MNPQAATILIVDDDPLALQGLQRALAAGGYKVHTADGGASALKMLEEPGIAPDLLLVDVMMPEISGLEVLRRVQAEARRADLPVMLITAVADK